MTDARSTTPEEYLGSTGGGGGRSWGRGRTLLVFVVGALAMLAVGVIFSTGASGQGADPVEGESFTKPSGTQVVSGTQYSGGKALKITNGKALPTKRVTITETSNVLVRARAGQKGGSPTLTIHVDGANAGTRRITSNVLSDYRYSGITLQSGTYTIGLKGGDLAEGRYVFVDVVSFPAVTPNDTAPAVSSTLPTNGANNIALDRNITLSFGESVTATTGSFTLVCGGDSKTFALSGSPGSSLTLDPTENLPEGMSCTVTALANQITDTDTVDPPDQMSANHTFSFTIVANQAPTDISLSNASVEENKPSGAAVGTLSTTDADAGETFTYSLVAGAGDTDNGSFQIDGDTLKTNEQFDFETKDSYSIRIRTTDSAGDSFEKVFTISVNNVNEQPTDISLSNGSIDENKPSGTTVGALSATDPDTGQTHTFSLANSGCGGGTFDNGSFSISGGELKSAAAFNFETKSSYTICVSTTDSGTPPLSFDKQFTIQVNDVNDAPLADDETFSGTNSAVGNTALIGNDPSDGAPSVNGPKKTISADILDGDTDEDGSGSLAVVAESDKATNDGGRVAIEADGDFTFTPAAGTSCSDTSDFFDYTLTDGNSPTAGTDTGRVTISISGCVWYVSNNASGNSGTSTAPFDTLAQAQSASAANHTIFLFDGDNTATDYSAGIDLKANQKLIGEAANLVVGSDTLHTGDAIKRPTITDSGADVVALDDSNEVRGLEIDPQGAGGGIAGATGDTGGATIDDVRIIDSGTAGTQPGLELDSTTGTFNISNLTVSTNGSAGVRLHNTTTPANAVNAVFAPAGQISITSSGAERQRDHHRAGKPGDEHVRRDHGDGLEHGRG
jgi:large repetitive protein